MKRYVMTAGSKLVLPPLIPGTGQTRLLPRVGKNSELAAVRAPVSDTLTLMGMDGAPNAKIRLVAGEDYHIVPQVGYQFAASPFDVVVEGQQNSAAAFRLGDIAELDDQRTIVPVMARYWADRGHEVAVHAIHRIMPAYVIGEIAAHAEAGWLITDNDEYRLGPDVWVDPRLFLIRELSGWNVRVVPHTFLVREFSAWVTLGGLTLETFTVAPT